MLVQNYTKLKAEGETRESLLATIETDAHRISGNLDDMTTRSVVYHHIYVCSGGNLIFSLLAAHGALWARWYLFLARFAAVTFAFIDVSRGFRFKRNMAGYQAYVDVFKNINRTVMVKTWTVFHMTKLYGSDDAITADMPSRLRQNLKACHKEAISGRRMPLLQLREFYEDYFRWEQVNVVGPTVDKAVFPLGRALVFKNFSDAEERTQRGLAAFDWACRKGKTWESIEKNLTNNPFFPRNFSFEPNQYFDGLRGLEECNK